MIAPSRSDHRPGTALLELGALWYARKGGPCCAEFSCARTVECTGSGTRVCRVNYSLDAYYQLCSTVLLYSMTDLSKAESP